MPPLSLTSCTAISAAFLQDAPTAGTSPVNSAITPILIVLESSLLQPQMPSERIIKSTRRITDFFMECLLFFSDIFPTVYKVRLWTCQRKYCRWAVDRERIPVREAQ